MRRRTLVVLLRMGWLTLVTGYVVHPKAVSTAEAKTEASLAGCEGIGDQLLTTKPGKGVLPCHRKRLTWGVTAVERANSSIWELLDGASEVQATGDKRQDNALWIPASARDIGCLPTFTRTTVVYHTRTHTTTTTIHRPTLASSTSTLALNSTKTPGSYSTTFSIPHKTTWHTSYTKVPAVEPSAASTLTKYAPSPSGTMAHNIFAVPIGTKPPPSKFKRRSDHPVPRTGIISQGPLQTNKFYANFQLGNQRAPTYTFPYSIAWAGGNGDSGSWGLAISHTNASQRVFGPPGQTGASKYFFNPVGIQSLVLSAADLGRNTVLQTDSITAFSARVLLSRDANTAPAVAFPIMQGMPYVTALYNGAVPKIESGVRFRTVTKVNNFAKPHVVKFNFTLEDGTIWRMYAHRTRGDELELDIVNSQVTVSRRPFYGSIQLAKDPLTPGAEGLLDDGAGVYPVGMELSGSAADDHASYTFTFERHGHDQGNLYMYALPHHLGSFDSETASRTTTAKLQSTVKGLATLVRGSRWTMVENLPRDMGLAPWHPEKGSMTKLSDRARGLIGSAARHELTRPMAAETALDSMYFAGKALAKFANLLYVANDLVGDKGLVRDKLGELQSCFGQFAANQQQYPLVYESAWGGVASSATYETGNNLSDFGNTYYNDHHFHYGYHILAAATIAHLDPGWLEANREYVDVLARDVANPSAEDGYFPMWRSFDWYHGHSWAHGLFESNDGKNQESSSEDVMHAYALAMWGRASGDRALEARSRLQLAVLARSVGQYYLYEDGNEVQPQAIVGNRVAGILFENKIDHATFFSGELQAIQGIHMIPVLAPTALVRRRRFVEEEWRSFFDGGRVDRMGEDGWKGIIYASYATVDPRKAWEFFSQERFEERWIDGGASRAWFMAYAAALGEL